MLRKAKLLPWNLEDDEEFTFDNEPALQIEPDISYFKVR
jgi:hypothetical protein